MPPIKDNPSWPELPYDAWKDTCATLQLWTQIAGKIRLVQTPWLNHSWHVVLYLWPRGLTTSSIPYGERTFQLDFDFLDHALRASTSDGGQAEIRLAPRSVADFYADLLRALSQLGIQVRINELPMRFPTRSASVKTTSTRLMTATSPNAFGAYWCSPSVCSASSARRSSASAVRCISFGEASIWR